MKTKIISLLGLLVIGVTAAYGTQASQPRMNGKLKVTTLAPEEICYTGKPYSKELGAYVFNYRNYDPQTSRWTTPDPSGFPNWANNYLYSNCPVNGTDPNGFYWQANAGGGATYIYMYNPENGPLNSSGGLAGSGEYVANPNQNYTGQCATGAQFLTGSYDSNGQYHDAGSTSNWLEGDEVTSSAPVGAMVACGWNDNGQYPSQPASQSNNHTGILVSQTDNTVTILAQQLDSSGNPMGLSLETINRDDNHDFHVVTSNDKYDPTKSDSYFSSKE